MEKERKEAIFTVICAFAGIAFIALSKKSK